MTDQYRLVHHPAFTGRLEQLSHLAAADIAGREADVVDAAFKALDVLKEGRERDFHGERLGFSPEHYDLRDCAEIKVAVFQEYNRSGKPMGPSHRMIYREYEPPVDDPRPVREVLAFEHRKGGLPYEVAATAINRQRGRAVDSLHHLPAPRPAVGADKDPDRPITPPRLPLPTDLAAASATSSRRFPGRPAEATRTAPTRAGRAATVHRDRH